MSLSSETLDEVVRLRAKIDEAKRTVICAPDREQHVTALLEAGGLTDSVRLQSSPFVTGTDVYVVNHLALGF